MPAAVQYRLPHVSEPVARDHQRAGSDAVVYLPRLLSGPPGTPPTQGNLGMIAKADHQRRIINVATAPALCGGSAIVLTRGVS